jgi:type IV secretory pathway VirB10-like protein
MKIFLSATFAVLLLAPTLPAQETQTETLPASSTTTPQAVPSDLPLIPETPAPTEKPRGTALPEGPGSTTKPGKKDKKSTTEITEAELAERIRFREAKTKALRDPAVQLQWKRSTRAETDFEKREALKSYYTLLFARIGRTDRTLTRLAATRQATAIRQLTQTRIDPTEPLDPYERAERFEGP